jgi:transcription elongation factor GreA
MSASNIITETGLAKAMREHAECVAKRKDISGRIEFAKEMGDLSENAEYHQAREDQSFNEGRIKELDALIKHATVVKKDETQISQVQLGSVVTVRSERGEQTYTIVGANETEPSKGKISATSPIGEAFLGKRMDETVEVKTPRGPIQYTVISVA